MKLLPTVMLLGITLLLSACLYGQCINGPCSFERERILNSIKAYGEFFEKPGMTKESWRADWVACGGKDSGGFFVDPKRPEDKDEFANVRRKVSQLRECMQNKGYEYRSNP